VSSYWIPLPRLLLSLCLACATALGGVARAQDAASPFKPEEIEALVAPVALYPDDLLSQVLMASTYPLEVVQAARWVKANPNIKGEAAVKAVENQNWDVSVKSLVAFPQVLEPMNDKLDWTQKLGDAFLADQKSVLDAVQRLRSRADAAGNLKSTEQQKVIVEQRLGLSRLSALLLAAIALLLPWRRIRRRLCLGRGRRRRGRDLRRLQLGARRRQYQRQPGRQHRPQLQSDERQHRRQVAARRKPSQGRLLPGLGEPREIQPGRWRGRRTPRLPRARGRRQGARRRRPRPAGRSGRRRHRGAQPPGRPG